MTTINDTCGCCEGADVLTPQELENRPGLPAIRYRSGTHATFLESMLARLASGDYPALQALTTRQVGDPAIALLDAWALVADILTFYDERIANEGYLATATERRSILELGRLVGYQLRPGVSASTFLAYLLDSNTKEETIIPSGSAVQSVPGPGELPVTFETIEPLKARASWNKLKPRLTRPQTAVMIGENKRVFFKGVTTGLSENDMLLFDQYGDGKSMSIGRVLSVIPEPAFDRTQVKVDDWSATPEPETVAQPELVDVDDLLDELVKQPSRPPAGSLRLLRKPSDLLDSNADGALRMLKAFRPKLRDSLAAGLSNAQATPNNPLRVYVMRAKAPLFGHAAAPEPQYEPTYLTSGELLSVNPLGGNLKPQPWPEWTPNAEANDTLLLERHHPKILPGSAVVVVKADQPAKIFSPIRSVQFISRTAYGISGDITKITLNDNWADPAEWLDPTGQTDHQYIHPLRTTLVYAQNEELHLVDVPVADDICGGDLAIELDGLHTDLESGRWLIVSGERTDLPGSSGVWASELVMLAGVSHYARPLQSGPSKAGKHHTDAEKEPLVGERLHTFLVLASPLAYCYKRDTVVIYGNVVKANHGESRREVLGSGNAATPLQAFFLKQPPLTFVAADNPAGCVDTLTVYVNDVAWKEVNTLVEQGQRDHTYTIQISDEGKPMLTFGNGQSGARLPTGVENIRAVYRSGIGSRGNVREGQLSLLISRPLGVKEVINPLRASGGADPESRDTARKNIPLAVMALDRLVSVPDYAAFARTFAGIAKASAIKLSDGRRQVVHVTIAGLDDIPIDPISDLFLALRRALLSSGDPHLAVRVDRRELILLVLSAGVSLLPGYQWEVVQPKIIAALLENFSFNVRELGQTVHLSEVIAVMQTVLGVAYIDVDVFNGLPEQVRDANGILKPITPDQIKELATKREERIVANLASVNQGVFSPAQIACFPVDVSATITLNLIEEKK